MNNHPVLYLLGMIMVSLIISTVSFGRPIRRMVKGDTLITNLEKNNPQLKTFTMESEPATLAIGVALFGTIALVGTPFENWRKHLNPPAAGGGGCSTSGGCGGGCGGGGCGGGGCGGGCGGGGD